MKTIAAVVVGLFLYNWVPSHVKVDWNIGPVEAHQEAEPAKVAELSDKATVLVWNAAIEKAALEIEKNEGDVDASIMAAAVRTLQDHGE